MHFGARLINNHLLLGGFVTIPVPNSSMCHIVLFDGSATSDGPETDVYADGTRTWMAIRTRI